MGTQEAPGSLELIREFVNTRELEPPREELDSPEALAAWMGERGLIDPATAVSDDDLAHAREVREAIRRLLLENNGESVSPGAPDVLTRAAERAGLAPAFGHGEARLLPRAGGVPGAIGRLLAIVAEAMAEGTWSRLKACSSHTCEWAFYDHARNRSRRWCEMSICGNRMKARAYRRRQAEATGSA
jgi:predicted RNA-binding Zn ribbon-like protein